MLTLRALTTFHAVKSYCTPYNIPPGMADYWEKLALVDAIASSNHVVLLDS